MGKGVWEIQVSPLGFKQGKAEKPGNLFKNRGGEFKQPLSVGSYVQSHLVVKEAPFYHRRV